MKISSVRSMHLPRFLSLSQARVLGLAYGLTGTVYVQLVGQLYISELLAIVVVAWVGPSRILQRDPSGWWVVVSYGLVLAGLLVADVFTSNSLDAAFRGWANTGFALIDTLFLLHLLRVDLKVVLYVLVGAGIARMFKSDINDVSMAINDGGNAFKVHVVPALTPILLVVLHHSRRLMRTEFTMPLIGLLYASMGARSAGVIFILASGLALWRRVPNREAQRLVVSLLLLSLSYFGYVLYVDTVLAGEEWGKAFDQLSRAANPYNPFALLAQGRAEFRVALFAISDSWLIGRGSWAEDTFGIFSTYQADITQAERVYYNPFIAAHSVVLTGWLWGGILGLAGMICLIFAVIRNGFLALSSTNIWYGLISYQLVLFSWHVLFSPIGHIRTTFPIVIALLFVVAEDMRRARS